MTIRPWKQTRKSDLDRLLNVKVTLDLVGLPNVDVSRPFLTLTDKPTLAEVEATIARLEGFDKWCHRQASPILRWTYSPAEHVRVQQALANERVLLAELQADRKAVLAEEKV